jgi:WD40-like Beta Propeller Repeat
MRYEKLVVILIAGLAAAADDPVAESAYLKGTEIYVTTAGSDQARQITSDGIRKGDVILSKDGRRIAFIKESHPKELCGLVVIRPDGTPVREIHFRPAGGLPSVGMRFVEGLLWISNQRLALYGSMNPSTVEYAVIDVKTGEEVGGYYVDGFTLAPSPDGSHVAYEAYIPHFSAEADHRPQLCIDDECGFGKPGRGYPGTGRHIEFTSRPVWSPDGTRVAITAADYTTKLPSVIVRQPGGKTAEFAPPPDAGGGLTLSWEDNTIAIKTANGQWKLQAGTSAWLRTK